MPPAASWWIWSQKSRRALGSTPAVGSSSSRRRGWWIRQAASAALRQSEWRREQKQQRAPVDAQVADTYFRPGEYVGAGQPVLSLLPPANIKARFFVPEAEVGRIKTGDAVQLSCDGCGAPIAARISRIAPQPEYTPPVIYSNAQRAKLVFMAEARPAPQDAPRLKPGQPLDVQRATAP